MLTFDIPALDSTSLATRHRSIYDGLADEYDARAERLAKVTGDSVDRMLNFGARRRRALDVGSGAGLVAEALVRAGYETTAIDVSPRMAQVCRTRVPAAAVVVADYFEMRFERRFDAIVAFAFIHLFPTDLAVACLRKMRAELSEGGVLLIGTTAEVACAEGFESKADYPGAPLRFRRRWTEAAFIEAVTSAGLLVVDVVRHGDPFGKMWADVVAVAPAPRAWRHGRLPPWLTITERRDV